MTHSLQTRDEGRVVLYRRIGAFFAMLAVAMIFRADTPTDWDSWDYAAQAVKGHSSDLCLGRWWFIALMRLAYILARAVLDVGPLEAFEVMQTVSALMMAGALVAAMAWTARLTKSPAAEVVLVCLILPGPLVGVYASAVMTESMTVLTLGLALLAWERAISSTAQPGLWALLAGLLWGVMIDIREPAIALCVWPVVSCFVDKPRRRWELLAMAIFGAVTTLTVGALMAAAWYPWAKGYLGNLMEWSAKMANEREQYPVSLITGLAAMTWYAFLSAPLTTVLAIPVAIWAAVRSRHPVSELHTNPRRLTAIMLSAIPYTIILLINHDLPINPRFVIPLIWFISPVVAAAIAYWFIDESWRYRIKLAATMAAVMGVGLVALAIQQGFITVDVRLIDDVLSAALAIRWGFVTHVIKVISIVITAAIIYRFFDESLRYRFRLAATVAAVLCFGLAALAAQWGFVTHYYFDYMHSQSRIYEAMQNMEEDAVVVPGAGAPVAWYLNRLKLKDFEIIGSGWDWPGENLGPIIADRLADDKPVYVNLKQEDWLRTVRQNPEWDQLSAVVNKYEIAIPPGPIPPTDNFMARLCRRPTTVRSAECEVRSNSKSSSKSSNSENQRQP